MPNDKINENQVCEQLGVSRTPVREAFIQLANDGYLDNHPRKGFRVKNLSIEKAQNLYELIGILDGRAAALTVDLITDKDIKQMEFTVDSMDSAIKRNLALKYYELQIEFHEIYLSKCPNSEIIDMLKKSKNSFFRKHYLFEAEDVQNTVLLETNSEHHQIVELFKKRDKMKLEAYIRDVHWAKSKAEFDVL